MEIENGVWIRSFELTDRARCNYYFFCHGSNNIILTIAVTAPSAVLSAVAPKSHCFERTPVVLSYCLLMGRSWPADYKGLILSPKLKETKGGDSIENIYFPL